MNARRLAERIPGVRWRLAHLQELKAEVARLRHVETEAAQMRARLLERGLSAPESPDRVAFRVEAAWCDRWGVFVRGWAHASGEPVLGIRLRIAEREVEAERDRESPLVRVEYPDVSGAERCGFQAYAPWTPGEPLALVIVTARGETRLAPDLGREGPPSGDPAEHPELDRFFAETDVDGAEVLEIGSRLVCPEAVSQRPRCARARYTGFDVHLAPNVDVAGDAHELSRQVGTGRFRGVFSLTVLEHVERPWVVAAEVNRALYVGGLTYHAVPHTWPAHEQPNDFWRFTEEGLAVLFGEATGFEVLGRGLYGPMQVIPNVRRGAYLEMPNCPTWGGAWILARKVRDVPEGALAWPTSSRASAARARQYPGPR